METLKAVRTTPYGIQLEDETYRNTSEPVRNYLKGKLPANLEITQTSEKDGKTTIEKVRVIGFQKGNSIKESTFVEARESKSIEMNTSYAKDILIAMISRIGEDLTDEDILALAITSAKVVKTIRNEIKSE